MDWANKLILALGGVAITALVSLIVAIKQGKVLIYTKSMEVHGTMAGKEIDADLHREDKLWEEVNNLRRLMAEEKEHCRKEMQDLEARVGTLEGANFRLQEENIVLKARVKELEFALADRDKEISLLLAQNRDRQTDSILIPDDAMIVAAQQARQMHSPL